MGLWKGSGEMAQQAKAPAAKPDDLSSIPRTYMVEDENQISHIVL